MPTRIYAFAKELGLDNKALIEICEKASIKGKGSSLASLDDAEISQIKAYMAGSTATAPISPAEHETGVPASPRSTIGKEKTGEIPVPGHEIETVAEIETPVAEVVDDAAPETTDVPAAVEAPQQVRDPAPVDEQGTTRSGFQSRLKSGSQESDSADAPVSEKPATPTGEPDTQQGPIAPRESLIIDGGTIESRQAVDRSDPKGIGEAVIGESFTVGPDFDEKAERERIISVILRSDGDVLDTSRLAKASGIPLNRVNGYCELMSKDNKISKYGRTSSGSYIQVTDGDRLRLRKSNSHGLIAPVKSLREAVSKIELPVDFAEQIKNASDLLATTASDKLELKGTAKAEEVSVNVAISIGGDSNYQREADDAQACLQVDQYATALAAFFENAGKKPDNDLCFGLFGHWGRGKSFLVNRTAKLLQQQNYSIVNFSAWKYRSTPETWAFLFKQVLDQGKKEDWRLPARSAFDRYGAWPVIGTICFLILSLLLRFAASDLLWMFQAFGLATTLYIVFTILKFWNAGSAIKAKYLFKGHDNKLGLQASIGDDLRSVLKAWVPDKRRDFLMSGWFWIKVVAYVTGCLTCLWLLWRAMESPEYLPSRMIKIAGTSFTLPNEYGTPVNQWGVFAIYIIFFALSVVVPSVLFWPFSKFKTKRVLLIVDDLDRCENLQMLEIIESTMLLLDDDEIRKRVQIVMLVEERAVRSALETKYQHLWNGKSEEVKTALKNQILTDNIEKIFLAHLRLPELTNSELSEVVGKYFEVDNQSQSGNVEAEDSIVQSALAQTTPSSEESVSAGSESLIRVCEIEADLVWTSEEKKVFSEIVSDLKTSAYCGRWGPRAIRGLLTRYQMARAILLSLGGDPEPTELVAALLAAGGGDAAPEGAGQIEIVASQVS